MIKVIKRYLDVKQIESKVFSLKAYWIKRYGVEFYTLGRNSYLDGKTLKYFTETNKTNKVLIDNFLDMYVDVRDTLENCIGEKLSIDHKFALPSFHIFKCDPVFVEFPRNWHMDYPHKTLELDGDKVFSFTYVVTIPSCGTGLEYMDNDEEKYLDYHVNDLIIHKGDFLHTIAPLKEPTPDEWRITLQGHVAKHNGEFIMYW